MQRTRQVTIKRVAREAKVSTQTVSRVINDRPDVAPETRQRVQQVISRLGYRPNAIARSLIQQRSQTLGVVATGLEYYGPSRTLVGVERQANELGYSLLLTLLHQPAIDHVEPILANLLSRQVDGIIWAVPEIGHNRAWINQTLPHLPKPVVFLSMQPQPGLAVVAVDNYHGAHLATDHLLAQSHRDIGLITGPLDWWEARERQRGWHEAMTAAGANVNPEQVVAGDWSAASGERGLRRLLDQYPAVRAVFACNDQMALGALQAARQLGRRIPDDLAIVGFDAIPESEYFSPPLTTVRQRLIELGGLAVSQLQRLIDSGPHNGNPAQPTTHWLKPELIIRESTLVR